MNECFIVPKSMAQLPDVRVSPPVGLGGLTPAASTTSLAALASTASMGGGPLMTFDDYEADFELAWLGYILAKSQESSTHLNVPAKNPAGLAPKAAYQRMAVSNDDLQQFDEKESGVFQGCNYSRSRSDTCLADEERCCFSKRKQPWIFAHTFFFL